MNIKTAKYLLLCLALMAGCNNTVFIEEEDRLKVSENETVLPDTGDTLHLSMSKEDWIITSVELKDCFGTTFIGNVREHGKLRTSTRMDMKGLGEIWKDYRFGHFKIIRDRYDALTVCMGPNLTHQDRALHIAMENEVESLELCYTQKATEGFVVDRIEWDELASSVISSQMQANAFTIINNTEEDFTVEVEPYKGCRRTVFVELDFDEKPGERSELLYILGEENIEIPIPDSYPDNGKLSFSGRSLFLNAEDGLYDHEAEFDTSEVITTTAGPGTRQIKVYLNYMEYYAHFRIYLKHVSDPETALCWSGQIHSKAPIKGDYMILEQ